MNDLIANQSLQLMCASLELLHKHAKCIVY